MRLYTRCNRPGAFDALAATASRANVAALVSADPTFAEAGITRVVPDARGVAQLLDTR